jgi:hypothetical protein
VLESNDKDMTGTRAGYPRSCFKSDALVSVRRAQARCVARAGERSRPHSGMSSASQGRD